MGADIFETLAVERDALLGHRVYREITTIERLRVFMEHHVFAVWDFFSLAKALQRYGTCVDVPWLPAADGGSARFINEIIIGEESDADGRGGYTSHFELYLEAMEEVGADRQPILEFVAALRGGGALHSALAASAAPPAAAEFVTQTLNLATSGSPHEIAAVFCFGREDIIPRMFGALVQTLDAAGVPCPRLRYYLERHIELDGDEHGPLAERLVSQLCAGNLGRVRAAERAARGALKARALLWDGVLEQIEGPRRVGSADADVHSIPADAPEPTVGAELALALEALTREVSGLRADLHEWRHSTNGRLTALEAHHVT